MRQLSLFEPPAEPPIPAVDGIPGDPLGRHAGVERPLQHRARQLWLRLELYGGRHRRFLTAGLIRGPLPREVQLAIEKRAARSARVRQEHANLAVLQAPGRPTILPLYPSRLGPLL